MAPTYSKSRSYLHCPGPKQHWGQPLTHASYEWHPLSRQHMFALIHPTSLSCWPLSCFGPFVFSILSACSSLPKVSGWLIPVLPSVLYSNATLSMELSSITFYKKQPHPRALCVPYPDLLFSILCTAPYFKKCLFVIHLPELECKLHENTESGCFVHWCIPRV